MKRIRWLKPCWTGKDCCDVLFCVPKEYQKSTRYFRSAGGTGLGLLAPDTPKEVGPEQKCWRFAHPREDLLTAFLPGADL